MRLPKPLFLDPDDVVRRIHVDNAVKIKIPMDALACRDQRSGM